MEAALAGRLKADRVPDDAVSFMRSCDLRYVGQGYELKIDFPNGEITADGLGKVWQDFHDRHAGEYGRAFTDSAIEIVNIRVIALGRLPKLPPLSAPQGSSLADAELRRNRCTFRVGGELKVFDTPVYQRANLPVEMPFDGPAIIVQQDSTTIVPPGAQASVHASGSIVITLGGRA
jgi:N-methylhydantoinase A